MADSIHLEQRGTPAVAICTEALRASADAMASVQGAPGYRYAVIPHPVSSLGPAELGARAELALPQVLEILLGTGRAQGGPGAQPGRVARGAGEIPEGASFDYDAAVAAIELGYDQGWSDGLPVVPPTERLVEAFLAQTKRQPDEVVWRMEQVDRECTVGLAAVNAAMAGCRPEYFPLVLAALEAVVDEGSAGIGGWQSTTGGTPLLVVNGPARIELGFNSRGSVFGSLCRPNATIGRAIRLIIMNVYGVRPHELDQATQSTPGKLSLCIAENEEESPWEPLHVELGFTRSTNVVSALHVRSCDYLDNRQTDDPLHILDDIVDTASRTGVMRFHENCLGVVLGPEHAALLASHGYSKADVKRYLAEHTSRTYGELERVGKDALQSERGWTRPSSPEERAGRDPDDLVHPIRSADQVLLVVAGAPNAGVSTVLQPFATRSRKVPGRAAAER